MGTAIGSRWERAGAPLSASIRRATLLTSFACSAVLLFAYFAQRTEWTAMGGRRGNRLLAYPDPSAWNLWVSVCGILAVAGLLVGLWLRGWSGASALAAGAAFALGAFAAAGYWRGISPAAVPPGDMALGPDWTFHPAGGLPVYVTAAVLGVASTLVLAITERNLAADEGQDNQPWPRGDGSEDAWFDRALHRNLHGTPIAPRAPQGVNRAHKRGVASGDAPLATAFTCAAFLLVAMVAPREAARTSWVTNHGIGNDSPAGYVFFLSACGLAALVGLGIAAMTPRVRLAAALLATVAFVYAAYRMVAYAWHLWSGLMGAEGHLNRETPWPNGFIDAPEALPVFLLAAVVGAAGTLTYAAGGLQRPETRPDGPNTVGGTGTVAQGDDRQRGGTDAHDRIPPSFRTRRGLPAAPASGLGQDPSTIWG